MALTAEERSKILYHIGTRWKDAACRRCGEEAWIVDGMVQLTLGEVASRQIVLGSYLPSAALICGQCGATEFVNLMVAGIMRP
jgi:ribosomal protein S27AE